jgi:hypothetical protein
LRGSSWCERNRVAHVFGLAGNKVLLARVIDLADEAAVSRVEGEGTKVCSYDEFLYAARTWATERRVITRGRHPTATATSPARPAGSTRTPTVPEARRRT